MPLARLSIKSATSLAKGAVSVAKSPSGPWWVVRVNRSAAKVVFTGEWSKPAAKEKMRERRIFLALVAIGVDEALAERLAVASGVDRRDWRSVVAAHVERWELTGGR
jgi:hypothetical protein